LKKLQKILPKDMLKQFEDTLEKMVKASEKDVDDMLMRKKKEIENV
jgi:ribosome recycling factor